MNLSKEETGPLSACISIEITPEDYLDNYNKKLKEYQKKSNIPGFRPGMAPMGMIKRSFGKALLAEEIDKLLNDSLENYLKENNIRTLGSPLINEEKTGENDLDALTNFHFHFDIGIHPEFDIHLSKETLVDYYKIIPTPEELETYVQEIRKVFGDQIDVEGIEAGDLIHVRLAELDEQLQLKENGIVKEEKLLAGSVFKDLVESRLLGLKTGDKLVLPINETSNKVSEIAYLLEITKDEAEALQSSFELEIIKISRTVPAEINGELFEKLFPGKGIETEEAFLLQLKDRHSEDHRHETEPKFFKAVRDKLLEETHFPLPEEFLKKWIKEKEAEKHDHEHGHHHGHEHEHEHEHEEPDHGKIFESMRWQLIENKIIQAENIQVSKEEIRNYLEGQYFNYFYRQGMKEENMAGLQSTLDALVDSHMEKGKDLEDIYETLLYNKLLNLFKEKLGQNLIEVTHDQYHEISGEAHHDHQH